MRIIFGVFAGFIVWSVLWVGTHLLLAALSPGWYGKIDSEFQGDVAKGVKSTVDSTVLILSLVRSIIFSIISGYAAAVIARESAITTLILGVLLLIVGLWTQISYWNYMPLWYHIPFLVLLIPMTILGGKLRKQNQMG